MNWQKGEEFQGSGINQDDIIKVWSGGSIKISQITDVDGLARYFGTCHNKRHNTGVMSKTMQKQSRWHYYPANVKIFTKSKGIKYPEKIDMPFLQTRKFLYDYVLSSEPTTYEIMSDDEKLLNVVSYENYKKK